MRGLRFRMPHQAHFGDAPAIGLLDAELQIFPPHSLALFRLMPQQAEDEAADGIVLLFDRSRRSGSSCR